MSKRKTAVPAALHSELSEYSSLIRALRTNHTLDVTHNLSKAKSLRQVQDISNQSDGDAEPTPVMSDTESVAKGSTTSEPGSLPSPSPPQCRKRKRVSSPTRRTPKPKRDAWTRWPLLAEDVQKPEWTLEDEISSITLRILRQNYARSLHANGDETGDEDEDFDLPSYLPYLTSAVSTYLSTVLSLLALHTPNRAPSLQNRVTPFGWRSVLSILSPSGDPNIANPKIINAVKRRMESTNYPDLSTSQSQEDLATFRIERRRAAQGQLRANLERHWNDTFSLAIPPQTSED